jgi:signal transduction histidine kinase
MVENLKSGEAVFEPRARLLKLLGGELIRDDVMAIVELVKNAHDADASMATLSFNATRDGSGEILVEDDGKGMTLDDFLTGWMQPAGSLKRKKEFHYTDSGRRVLGEKGVGRFAVDRLGRYVELISRAVGEENEIVASFDWDAFDDGDRALSEITSTWRERQPERFTGGSGTLLRISGLRSHWTQRNFRKLSSRLKRLISPFGNGNGFKIRVTSDEFPDYSGAMESQFLEKAPYRIVAKFDGKDTIHYQIGEKEPFSTPWEGSSDPQCGPAKLTLHCFDLDSEGLASVGTGVDVRAWLREWSGVNIYRDGFRVLPYGEPDDDWLRLDQRRVNNPVVCLSNNQVCGFFEISADGNTELNDQTNRGGLQENDAFQDLRTLALDVFRVIEAERQAIRNPGEPVNGKILDLGDPDLFSSRGLLDLLTIDKEMDGNLKSVLEPRFKAIREEVKKAEHRTTAALDSYLDLSGLGQTATFMGHALENHLRGIKKNLKPVMRRANDVESLETEGIPYQIQNMVDELSAAVEILSRGTSNNRQKITRVDLVREINSFVISTSHMLVRSGVFLSIDDRTPGIARVLIYRDSLEQVLYALLSNSLDAFNDEQKKKEIRIVIGQHGNDAHRLIFEDNGTGINDSNMGQIFQSGFSSKENSRGMGLTVARNLMKRVGGDIRLLRDRRRPRWTSFEIEMKTKKPRAT